MPAREADRLKARLREERLIETLLSVEIPAGGFPVTWAWLEETMQVAPGAVRTSHRITINRAREAVRKCGREMVGPSREGYILQER